MESGPTTIHAKRLVHDFIIWHGHLWGGRFQMAVIGDARLQTVMAGNPQTEKSRHVLDVEGFWLGDKCWITADNNTRHTTTGLAHS